MKTLCLLLLLLSFSACCATPTAADSDSLPGDTVTSLSKNIMVVYQDKKNTYWFGSWEDGLYSYDGKTLLHYTTADGLPHNRIEEIKEDRTGSIYVTTSLGVSKFEGSHFTTLPVVDRSASEWKLDANDLWFKNGQEEDAVFRYDGEKLHTLKLPGTPAGDEWVRKHPFNPSPYAVYTIYNDSHGNVWFGTAALGACRYDGNYFQWISEEDVNELHNGPANGVRSIIEDKDGYFWFNSTYRYNVYGMQPTVNPLYGREKSIGNLDGKKDSNLNEYLSIAKDKKDNLWIATYDDGIFQIKGKKIVRYPIQADGKDITAFYIYSDNSGNIWVGTHENGVYQFNGKAFKMFVF